MNNNRQLLFIIIRKNDYCHDFYDIYIVLLIL
jgi:hypothetical protein